MKTYEIGHRYALREAARQLQEMADDEDELEPWKIDLVLGALNHTYQTLRQSIEIERRASEKMKTIEEGLSR